VKIEEDLIIAFYALINFINIITHYKGPTVQVSDLPTGRQAQRKLNSSSIAKYKKN